MELNFLEIFTDQDDEKTSEEHFMKCKLSILLASFSFMAWSRKPAVEPYVGVESQHYAPVTQGT